MSQITIHPFSTEYVQQVVDLQQAYSAVYQGVPVFPGEMYLSPGFHGGQDVFCATMDHQLVGYAPVYAQLVDSGPEDLPHQIWTEIKVRPDLPEINDVKDCLMERVIAHAGQLVDEATHQQNLPERKIRILFEYRVNEVESAAYVQSRGFQRQESVFSMRRDLTAPFPQASIPAEIRLEQWKMDSLPDQVKYVAARNECFPEAPVQLDDWRYFLGSPMWAVGTSIAAFAGEDLAGNVAVYWDETANAQSGVQAGYTEFIFVRPSWRGKGIAQAMIVEGMRYLREHGMTEARLEVRALNEHALRLYQGLGYVVVQESRFYAKDL
jgi:ribosomal protein S18 acetylase RimI-like enzyme